MSDAKKGESEKRKKADNDDAVSGRRKKARDDEYGDLTAVTEEEVEEFYAILRRINIAVSYFKKGNGDGKWLKAMLNGGHYEEDNGVKEARREEGVEENAGLDLNADPDP